MAFLFTWNATFEGQPADDENASLGAGRIRDLKSAVSERLEVDHSWAGDASDGLHLQVTMPQHATSPTVAANQGAFYVKDSGGTTVPYFKDDAGNTRQILYGATGDRGDITVSADGLTWTIDNNAVTFAKLQDINTATVIGRSTAGSGDPEALTVTDGLTISGGALHGTPQASSGEISAESNVDKYIAPDLLVNSKRVAKAWVNFNGTGVVAIRDSVGVASISDNGTGNYTVNLNALASGNYAVAAIAYNSDTPNAFLRLDSLLTTTTFNLLCRVPTSGNHDAEVVSAVVFL